LKKIALISTLFWLSFFASAQEYYFDYQGRVEKAVVAIFALQFEEGVTLLNEEKKDFPKNLAVWHVENYIDFLRITLDGNRDLCDQLEDNLDKRVEKLELAAKSDPYRLFALADLNLQWAVAKGEMKYYFSSFRLMRRGYKQLIENQERFPNFVPTLVPLGFVQALIGSVPSDYQWAVNAVGLDGDYIQGVANLENAIAKIKNDKTLAYLLPEALMFSSMIALNISGEKDDILEVISDVKQQYGSSPNSLSFTFLLASAYMKTGQSDSAIRLLQNRPTGDKYFTFHQLDYMLGKAFLYSLDENCVSIFKKYISESVSENYIPSSSQMIAWSYLIDGDTSNYWKWINKIEDNSSYISSDKQAYRAMKKQLLPNPYLLKARLLFDGGFYSLAKDVLNNSETKQSLKNDREILEMVYRTARVAQESGNIALAIAKYKETIALGENEEFYFAANSALKLGNIYEKRKQYTLANYFYDLCLNMDFEEYHSGITQKAKAGIERVK